MTQITRPPTFFPRRINMYVPAMAFAADFSGLGPTRCSFGSPAPALATGIVNGVSAASGLTILTGQMGQPTSDARYGRTLTYALSGAGTPVITATGQDFWGQTINETVTANGATPVVGLKAFMNLIQITCGAVGMNLNVGWGTNLGLPYKCMRVIDEDTNTSNAGFLPGTVGTLTPPVLTDPATASTGDPRGTYLPNAALATNKEIVIAAIYDNSINAAGNGGLLGIRGA